MTDHQTKTLRTTSYLLRLAPEEKAELEQKTRIIGARMGKAVTLAHVLREGAGAYLDDIMDK